MKKLAVLIILLSVGNGASAQDWRDTLNMARSAYKKQDYKKAVKLYEKAQKGAPENVDLSNEMAQSAYKAEDYNLAEKIYQQGQVRKSDNKTKANNYHNLGNARMKSENYQGAIDAYKDALRINPDDEQTRYNLSEAKRRLEKQNQSNNSQQEQNQNNNSNGGSNNNQDNNSGQQSDQDQSSEQNNSGNNNNSSKQGNENQRNNGSDSQKGNNQGQLSDKTAERMLEDLLKREAETKRRMAGGGNEGGKAKSGKDW